MTAIIQKGLFEKSKIKQNPLVWNDDGSGMPSLSSFIVISPKKLLVQIETTTAFNLIFYSI